MIYYLPIYFQAIYGMSPSASGIRSLPLILAMSIALLASSTIVTWAGYFQPLLFIGGILLTVGSGMIYTLDGNSSPGQYIGYQILVGVGNGICSQIPLIASIAFAKPEDIPITTSLVLCEYNACISLFLIDSSAVFQLVSGAISVSLAQSLFANILISRIPIYAPTVDPATVIAVGASELRNVFSPEELDGILLAYMAGLKAAWAGGVGLAGLTLLVALIPKWKSIKNVSGKQNVVVVG